jgi:hypothetical protein
MAIVQDGMDCPFFAPCVYDYCCCQALTDTKPDIMDIPDPDACLVAKKIANAEGPGFDDVVTDNRVLYILSDAGCTKALLYRRKQDMLSSLAFLYCLLNVKAELDQFCEGLKTFGVLSKMKDHPQMFRCLFVSKEEPLTAIDIKRLLKQKKFSEKRRSNLYSFL